MEIFRNLSSIGTRCSSAVALGFFDGLHIGHIELISSMITYAQEHRLSADIFTFSDHPKNAMSGTLAIPRLMTEAEKLDRLAALGVDRVFDFDFAHGFHTMSPDFFAHMMIKESFSAEAVFCGFNFRFGADAAGDPKTLRELGRLYGYKTFVIKPVHLDGMLVSSSVIRRSINSGDAVTAGFMLGKDYSMTGVVEEGRRLGHTLGFPTANITPDPQLTLPALGVYVTEVYAKGSRYRSVSNVGVNPTVASGNAIRLETHLLGEDIELYGETITVFLKKMLRAEQRFDNEEALKLQISSDVEAAKNYYREHTD